MQARRGYIVTHMSTPTPRTLDELRTVRGDEEIVRAADAYITNGRHKLQEALSLRDAAVRRLAEKHGPSEAARRVGKSLSTIKLIRGRS